MNAANKRVKRELTDRNSDTTNALVANAQDALAVSDNNDVHSGVGTIAQNGRDRIAPRIGNEKPARPAIDVTELFTSLPYHGRVDNRHHLLDVTEQKAVEKNFVSVL